MTTLFHFGTPDDVLILALRDHSDPAVTELLARYIPFVGVDLDDYVLREEHKRELAEKDKKIEKYKAALVHARSELATVAEMLGSLSDKIAGGIEE
jgi:hypothetical protein